MSTSLDDRRYMALALALGARGLGNTWPNPAVGCVIVRNGCIVGRGWTQPGGRPHAEVVALAQAGAAAKDATVYVSLEPCAHHGLTPPCASALIGAGVARVVTAMEDPDLRVSGDGHEMLRIAGIAVDTGVLAGQAAHDHRGFVLNRTRRRPLLTLKLASSFDGRIATATGESQWITGEAARRAVHVLRARHDAVMIGAGTAREDDPTLTVRGLGITHQPVRVVCTRKLDLPAGGKLAKSARKVPLWICHGAEAEPEAVATWQGLGAKMLPIDVKSGRQLDMRAVLKALAREGLTRVLCEGGGALAASLLGAGLIDEIVGFTAGLALGAEGRPSLGALGVDDLSEAPRFTLIETRAIGGDVMHRWARD